MIDLLSSFNKSGTTRVVANYLSKTFDRVCDAGLLHKLNSCNFRSGD